MEQAAIMPRLTGVFQDIFAIPNLAISPNTTAADVPGWDSLSHINLVLAVERNFSIRLTTREVRGMKNVGDLVDLIAKKAG